MYLCVCLRACVCVKGRKKARERDRNRERLCVCVCEKERQAGNKAQYNLSGHNIILTPRASSHTTNTFIRASPYHTRTYLPKASGLGFSSFPLSCTGESG